MKSHLFFLTTCFIFSYQSFALDHLCNHYTELEQKEFYTKDDQINALCDLQKKISDYYSENIYKSFPKKLNTIFTQCYQNISHDNLPSYKLNDLLKKCIALFNNSHLRVNNEKAPDIFLPFDLVENNRQFIIKSMFTDSSCDLQTKFQLGDQIISIDGEKVEDVIHKLSTYESASSSTARRLKALSSISYRNYAIRDSSKANVTIIRNGQKKVIEESYFFFDANLFNSDRTTLISKGYKPCSLNGKKKRTGYYYSLPLYKEKWSFTPSANSSQRKSAYFARTPNACYFKLNNFDRQIGHFSDGQSNEQDKSLWERLSNELEACDADGDPLIIDLQNNHGGRYSELGQFMSLIKPKREDPLLMFRTLRFKHSLMGHHPCFGDVFFIDFPTLINESFNGAFCQDLQSYSKWQRQGYHNKIVVLTSPYCISSCDIASASLKTLDNVTIIGQPTQGAFNGISNLEELRASTSGPISFSNTDLTTYIEDYAPIVPFNSPDRVCGPYQHPCFVPLEGKPITPHIPHEISLKDILSVPFGAILRSRIARLIQAQNLTYSDNSR